MTEHLKAKIFLAEERGLQESNGFRSYHTFNSNTYFNEYKTPFRSLYLFNDDTLAAGASLKMAVEECSYVILLPVAGAITYKDDQGNDSLIGAGEIQVIHLSTGSTFELSNPYDNELVNFLQVFIRSGSQIGIPLSLLKFNLEDNKNRLQELSASSVRVEGHPKLTLGQFRGREEALYKTGNKNNGLFVFIIEGAFEVSGRLLHSRDGLTFWDLEDHIELEALSNEAIVLLIELKQENL